MIETGSALADAIESNLGGWVARSIVRRAGEAFGTVRPEVLALAEAAGAAAAADFVPRVRVLLAADVDAQATTPLAIVREAVQYATRVLAEEGVPPLRRDRFATARFPDDLYDLTPGSLAALGEDVGELAIAWGAAKAWEHKRRHGG